MNFYQAKEYITVRMNNELAPDRYYYHNTAHTLNVLKAADEIAVLENVKGEDLLLLRTAALYHDAGFLLQYQDNEPFACDIVREILPQFAYSNLQIERICRIIMATALPHQPRNILDDIICDADLDYLGISETVYQQYATALRRELEVFVTTMSDDEWLERQVKFLSNHRYFTKTEKERREPGKQQILSKLQQQLNHIKQPHKR